MLAHSLDPLATVVILDVNIDKPILINKEKYCFIRHFNWFEKKIKAYD